MILYIILLDSLRDPLKKFNVSIVVLVWLVDDTLQSPLIKRKNRSGLMYPSVDVVNICTYMLND